MICQSFALRAILNGHPCSTYGAGPGGVPDLGRASHLFCLRHTHELIPHSQRVPEREREICLSRGRGGWGRRNVGMSEWMEWRAGHVTPTLDDRVSVNVIAVIITAYMMKWQKVLTSSVLIFAVCVTIL